MLLIQGVGVVGNGWTPQVDELGGRFTLISFDNRGIGASISRDGRLTIEDMAADALGDRRRPGFERFHVAGHSMGGVIAQAVALSAPARVKSLAFLCTFARGKDGSKVTLPMLATALRMRIGTRAMRRNAFPRADHAGALPAADRSGRAGRRLHPLFGHDLAEQPPIVMKQLRAMSKYDAGARLAGLAVDTHARRVGRRRPHRATVDRPGAGRGDSRLKYVEIADAGHGLPIHRAPRPTRSSPNT